MRHHIVEEIPENRGDKHVEELEFHHEKSHANDARGIGCDVPGFRQQMMHRVADATGETQQSQKHAQERQRGHDIGNPSTSRPAVTVTFKAHPRTNRHVQHARKCCNDQRNRPVRRIQMPELERDNRWRDRFHHLVTKIAPEQPSEEGDQSHLRVGESADSIAGGGIK